MNKFIKKTDSFKASDDRAEVLDITATGDFENSNKIIFIIESKNNPMFDVKAISAELLEKNIVILTERGNELNGTEGISLFLKNWYIAEYKHYLTNCLVRHFVTSKSTIITEITLLGDKEPYQVHFKFPKNVIEDSYVKNFTLTLESGEFYLEYEERDGYEIFESIEHEIKSFTIDLINKITKLNKYK